jgi:hypothetical protein
VLTHIGKSTEYVAWFEKENPLDIYC